MAFIISVYSEEAFKEILLPALNNADSSVILYKDVFRLKEDLVLPMEVMDHRWRFLYSPDYKIQKEGQDYIGRVIQNRDVLNLTLREGKRLSLLVKETRNSFAVFEKYRLDGIRRLTIGKLPENDIQYNSFDMVSKRHALLERDEKGWCIKDQNSANGVFVNYLRMGTIKSLQFGDLISIMGLNMIFLGDILAIDTSVENLRIKEDILLPLPAPERENRRPAGRSSGEENHYFHRVPRNMEPLAEGTMEIDPPPSPGKTAARSALLTVGPSLTMALPMLLGCAMTIYASRASGGSSVFMYTGLVTAVSSALVGTVWALANMKKQKQETARQEEKRRQAYGQYLDECARTLMQQYEQNGYAMQNMYPAAYACSFYDENSMYLWNRNVTHEDFLFQRLGIGEVPFQVKIGIPKKRFSVEKDLLAERPEDLKNSFAMLKDVPVGVDLKEHRLIGVIGGSGRRGAYQVAKCLILQTAANICYTDVKIALLYDQANSIEAENLKSVKWLPHVWSEDKRIRYVGDTAVDAADVLYELTAVVRKRAEEAAGNPAGRKMPKPHYLLVVTDPALLEGELIAKYVYEPREEYGLTTVILVERYEDLPNACEYIVENDGQFQGIYSVGNDSSRKQHVVFDDISGEQMENFARRLSRIEVNEIETGGEIPADLSFLDMYHVGRIEDLQVENRWMKNRTYDSMKALIGQKAGGAPCYLDVHEKYHGPHGLVAGTTGSGKSELLQTYILSLAVNYSPDDISFFIIDFKGGGMANLFAGLPHMAGQISNLSGNQIRRAMVSIKSENRRRQRLFNEHSVNNINQYTRLYKDNEASVPIPHLFIIIDEFAELKREEPDFMRELISVAQVGRSLGVHLILATQKPSGTVDDNIWSNSKFRLCLRVQDRQDSSDMLHKPDAAYLTQAGRCYLQVGNDELYELFQSGYSGAVYDDKVSGRTDLAKMVSITGRAALVGNRIRLKQKEENRRRWIELLTELTAGSEYREDIFQRLKERGIDYPDTDYNRRRVEEFTLLYEEAVQAGYGQTEKAAAYIMAEGEKRGSKLPQLKEKTQLDAIVEYLQKLAREKGYRHRFMLWLPVLPEKLYLSSLPGFSQLCFDGKTWREEKKEWELQAYVGLYDHPVNQVQLPLEVNLAAEGHHAVLGMVSSGKSTFLQTLLFSLVCRYTPEHVNIYGIDFGSRILAPFEGLAHVGGIMYENDLDKLSKFFNMILTMMKERKERFQGGNYAQYVQANGLKVPAVVIAIDQYAGFREKTKDRFEEAMVQIAREGAGYGIFLVITAAGFGSAGIPARIGDNIRTVISLEMNDKYQYREAMRTMQLSVLPEPGVKGRGLAKAGESVLEFQTALALEAEDDYERAKEMGQVFEQMNQAWKGASARPVPSIPEKPVLEEYMKLEAVRKTAGEARWLPIGYNTENADLYSIDLSRTFCYLVSGKSRTGKTNLLKVMMHTAALKESSLHVVDGSGALGKPAQELGADYITEEEGLYRTLSELVPLFRERNKMKRDALREGYEDEEIYEKMSRQVPHFFFIDDLPFFVRLVTKPKEGVGDMRGFMENITDKGRLHNVFFIAAFNQDQMQQMAGIPLYENMVRDKKGIHLGGNTAAQRMFNFDYLPYAKQGKEQKAGIGMLPSGEGAAPSVKVAVPYAGRNSGGNL
ncbi:MAG: type VII secretion protein EssC [Ruminococcus sp.]|jgi:S-DNA-T family DNA segregation ATPase FtsK/SpoIIIE